jgi:hypothetical protein
MVMLPETETGGEITFYYQKTVFEVLGIIVSIASIVALLGYLLIWRESPISKFKESFMQKVKGKVKNIKKSWEDEND